MSGSENGQDSSSTPLPADGTLKPAPRQSGSIAADGVTKPRPRPPRSASPAKRSAREMEESGRHEADNESIHSDQVMPDFQGGSSMDTDTQVMTAQSSVATSSVDGTITGNTSATSFQSEDPPAYSMKDESPERGLQGTAESIPSIDEQVRRVMTMNDKTLEEGDRGVVIASKWLVRVLSRTSDKAQFPDFPKEAREGPIGPLDSSSIIAERSSGDLILHDTDKQDFIPLRPGLQMGADVEVLPYEAYGLIVGWYGISQGQKAIIRYAHNTAPDSASSSNVQYELYPPIFTVRKVPQPGQDGDNKAVDKSRLALLELRLKKERESHGQRSPDDALRLVSSRFEKYQKFLTRAKDFAGIPMQTKVKTWRSLKPSNIAVDLPDDKPPNGTTDGATHIGAQAAKLIVEDTEWQEMAIGKDIEHVDVRDETSNEKYNGGSTMETFALFDDQTLIFEEMIGGPAGGEYASDTKKKLFGANKKNGSLPRSADTSGRSSPTPGGGITTRGRARRDGKTRGTVGLSNLGNTCYMNSALQCIRSVEELAIYFLDGKFKREINATNPLGHKGAMATKYAEVLKGIYGDNAAGSFSPVNFKSTLGRLMPTFSGFGQQDSQEFLSFLVDALHEDLNRIEKKPYLENPDSDDNRVGDAEYIVELGETYRSNYRARNDSIAMDLFCGFYKNTMECPVCDKISVTFDPYSLLTVQLPMENSFSHVFIFFPRRGRPVKHDVDAERSATLRDVKKSIASKHPGVDPQKLWMAEIYNHKVYKVFDDASSVAEANIQGNDHIFLFELDDVPTYLPPSNKHNYSTFRRESPAPGMDSEVAEVFAVPIFHRRKSRHGNAHDVVLHAQYISLTREEAKSLETIEKKILLAVARMTSRPILIEAEEGDGGKEDDGTVASSIETTQDDPARISDHSVASEDGYVDVSFDKKNSVASASSGQASANGDGTEDEVVPVPRDFMDASYTVPSLLKEQLFHLNYAKGSDSGFCTGMNCFEDRTVRSMQTRVKVPSRRGSTDSASTEVSSTSLVSAQANVEVEESDEDEDEAEQPEPTTRESSMTLQEETSDDGLPEVSTFVSNAARSGRAKGKGKDNKFRNGPKQKKNKPSKREKRLARQQQRDSARSSSKPVASWREKDEAQSDNPYYLQLGECIVLDWHAEAYNSLFDGNAQDVGDVRGHAVSDETGKGTAIFDDPAVRDRRSLREAKRKQGLSLEDCFAETGKREKLSEDNAWYCSRCKELRQATKTLDIWTLPDVLVVHLKRFGGNRRFQDKIDVLVDYPVEGLDLNDKVGLREGDKNYVYDLFAIDNHYGGLGGGHYTATAKNFFDGQWYDYNDSICSKVGDAPRRSAAAYLLFYRRRSEQSLGPKYLQELVGKFHGVSTGENGTADESDSGEGGLGDRTSILHGSSSISAGAGVAATKGSTNGRKAGGAVDGSHGAQVQAERNRKTSRNLGRNDDEGIALLDEDDDDMEGASMVDDVYGRGLQAAQTQSWGFDTLKQGNDDDDDDMNSLAGDAGDVHSRMEEDFHDASDAPGSVHPSSPADWNDTEHGLIIGDDEQPRFDGHDASVEETMEDSPAIDIVGFEDEEGGHVAGID